MRDAGAGAGGQDGAQAQDAGQQRLVAPYRRREHLGAVSPRGRRDVGAVSGVVRARVVEKKRVTPWLVGW